MKLRDRIIDWADAREPDQVIGGRQNPYLWRWYLIPRNRFLNIYVHLFLRSDDDRALHDHPWMNLSILLSGRYREWTQGKSGRRSLTHKPSTYQDFEAGDWRFRWSGRIAHRIALTDGPCWTLFVTGPRYREWGFLCSKRWVPWKEFTAADDPGQIGPGCGE